MSDPRVTLYGRPGCHLCDDARAVVERVCADLGESYEEISILDDPALLERYGEEIPVTFVDGRQHDFWRVDEAAAPGRPALSPWRRDPGRRSSPAAVVLPTALRFCSRVHKRIA